MIRSAMIAAAMALGLAVAQAQADEKADLARMLATAMASAEKNDCKLADWDRILTHPAFADLPSRVKSASYLTPVMCGVAGGRSFDLIKASTAEPDALLYAWNVRFAFSAASGSRSDALMSLETMADKAAGAPLRLYDDRFVFRFWAKLKDDKPARARMAAALERADWAPVRAYSSADQIWLPHAIDLIDAQKDAEAARFARKINTVRGMILLRADRRFGALIDAKPADFDVKFTALASLAANQERLAKTPDDAGAIQAVAYDLRVLGRFGEALALLDAALKQPELRDQRGEDRRNWIQNERASVLWELGRFDDSARAMRDASQEREHDGPNVSQAINLAGQLNDMGRFEDALEALKPLAKGASASAYGKMWIATNKVCAYAGLQRMDQARAEMTFVESHASDNRRALRNAALCLGDEDAAARALIAHIGSDDRAAALAGFSKGRIETPLPPTALMLEERAERVRQRPDVRAVFDVYGRAETFDINLGPIPF